MWRADTILLALYRSAQKRRGEAVEDLQPRTRSWAEKTKDMGACAICLEEIKDIRATDLLKMQPCGHYMCHACFVEYSTTSCLNDACLCPLCRQEIISTTHVYPAKLRFNFMRDQLLQIRKDPRFSLNWAHSGATRYARNAIALAVCNANGDVHLYGGTNFRTWYVSEEAFVLSMTPDAREALTTGYIATDPVHVVVSSDNRRDETLVDITQLLKAEFERCLRDAPWNPRWNIRSNNLTIEGHFSVQQANADPTHSIEEVQDINRFFWWDDVKMVAEVVVEGYTVGSTRTTL